MDHSRLLPKEDNSAKLNLFTVFSFGFGHIQNDLYGTMWFGYILIYYTMVLELSNEAAGMLMMIGQIADGIGTILVGYLITRSKHFWFNRKYGNKKSWHLLGTVLSLVTFPLMFRKCVLYEHSITSETVLVIYYAFVNTVCWFGWAATQISHLSMITATSSHREDRYSLTSSQYKGTIFANFVVIALFAIVLSNEKKVLPSDNSKFEEIDLWVLIIGAGTALTFHICFRLEERVPDVDQPEKTSQKSVINNCYWFGQMKFYFVTLVYTMCRLFYTVAQTFMPIYVEQTLNMSARNIAMIPALMYLGGLLVSLSSQKLIKKCGLENLLVCCSCFGISLAIWIFLGYGKNFVDYQVYPMAMLVGMVQSLLQICSLDQIALLVEDQLDGSSFVYGFMSFTDKLVNGITIYFLEKFALSRHSLLEGDYYKDMMAATFFLTLTLVGLVSSIQSGFMYKVDFQATQM